MLIVNHSIEGDWLFKLFLLTWLVSVAVCVLLLGYLSARFFKLIRPVLTSVMVYAASFIICSFFMASMDPNGVGWLNNLVGTFGDTGTLYLIVFPYAASMIIASAWCAAGFKSKTPVAVPADQELV